MRDGLLENIDHNLLLKINSFHSPFMDHVMWWISHPSFGIPFYLLAVFLLYKYYGLKKALFLMLIVGLVVVLSDLSAKYLFKEAFQRYRPSHHTTLSTHLHFVNDYKGGQFGFVSSHAANMFGIVTFLALWLWSYLKHYCWLFFLWAALIGYSRMYLGVHYPSDIVAGAMLGMSIAFMVFAILVKVYPTIKLEK